MKRKKTVNNVFKLGLDSLSKKLNIELINAFRETSFAAHNVYFNDIFFREGRGRGKSNK